MRRRMLAVVFAAGCMEAATGDGLDDSFLVDGKADSGEVAEWSDTACAVLKLANEGSFDVLDDDARLNARSAKSIVDGRAAGTYDTLAELDAVKWVGPVAFRQLRDFAESDAAWACSFPPLSLQILSVSDWHGQVDPVSVTGTGNVGGAGALSAYFARDRAANPSTLTLTAGDGFGATPPLVSFFEERPAVEAMNLMGFDADGLGNHNFDRGVAHLEQMARLARYPYLSANLSFVEENMTCPDKPQERCVQPYRIFDVNGARVAVIGVTNPDAKMLVKPGSFGTIQVDDPVEAALAARDDAARDGANVFVAIVHMGATGAPGGVPVGPLMDFAAGVEGFDLILGDHTNVPVNLEVNGALVVENKSQGLTYARITLQVDRSAGAVLSRHADIVTPLSDAVTADPAIVALLAPYRTELAKAFDDKIGVATGILPRGNNVERLGEVALGNLVTDSMRVAYGTQLGFTNGGGLRAALPSSYAPLDKTLRRPATGYAAGPPYDLVIGDVYAVLPFGNSVVTRTITGAQLWAMMEHSVEALPLANGWFGQISGFKVTFDSSKAVGARILTIALDDGTPVGKDETRYTMATSDFVDVGGDGYTMLVGSDGVSRDKMADVLLAHIKGLGTVSETLAGRLVDLKP
jgi:5'-nucleotidase